MTANHSIDPVQFLSEHLDHAEPDLLRAMLATFIDALMGAEADALCGAPYGARSDDRVNSRNGYRSRDWDTRAGTMDSRQTTLRAIHLSRLDSSTVRAATGVRRGAGPGWVAGPDGRVASAASSSARDERRVGCSGQGHGRRPVAAPAGTPGRGCSSGAG